VKYPSSVDELTELLGKQAYLADRGLATAVFLGISLGRPILLEGEPGVGKTEMAKALAAAFGSELIRLQCYEGIDANQALYEWDYTRQLLYVRALSEREALYGTGERFDAFNRRGGRFDVRVYEQYKNQGARTYMPVPLLLSSQGYALFIEGTRPVFIDAGATDVDTLVVEAEVDRTGTTPLAAPFNPGTVCPWTSRF